MNILAVKKNKFQVNEIREFFAGNTVFFASVDYLAIQKLNNNNIDLALISINSNYDFGLVKYIKENFKNVKIILSVSEEIETAMSVLSNDNLITVKNPLKLKDLKELFNKPLLKI